MSLAQHLSFPPTHTQSVRIIRRLLRRFVRYWRNTAWIALCVLLFSSPMTIFCPRYGWWGMALSQIWMLTVPCGIPDVNTNKTKWALRQLLFAGTAALFVAEALSAMKP